MSETTQGGHEEGYAPGELEKIEKILTEFKNIAVVGMSKDEKKPSFRVGKYLHEQGYKIFPVNPTADEILGLKVYKSLEEIPERVDVVDIFRPPKEAVEIVKQAVKRAKEKGDVKAVWLQEGIVSEEAKKIAEEAGLLFIQNRCMFKEHLAWRVRHKGEEKK